jgi:DNA repair exonuclease SbcCD ATPase subunit
MSDQQKLTDLLKAYQKLQALMYRLTYQAAFLEEFSKQMSEVSRELTPAINQYGEQLKGYHHGEPPRSEDLKFDGEDREFLSALRIKL